MIANDCWRWGPVGNDSQGTCNWNALKAIIILHHFSWTVWNVMDGGSRASQVLLCWNWALHGMSRPLIYSFCDNREWKRGIVFKIDIWLIHLSLHSDLGEMHGAASHSHAFECMHAVAIGIVHATIALHYTIGALVITITSFNFIT